MRPIKIMWSLPLEDRMGVRSLFRTPLMSPGKWTYISGCKKVILERKKAGGLSPVRLFYTKLFNENALWLGRCKKWAICLIPFTVIASLKKGHSHAENKKTCNGDAQYFWTHEVRYSICSTLRFIQILIGAFVNLQRSAFEHNAVLPIVFIYAVLLTKTFKCPEHRLLKMFSSFSLASIDHLLFLFA